MDNTPDRVLNRLKEGNERFVREGGYSGDVSKERLSFLAGSGQKPFAVVVACSDSRVIPEAIFSSGAGELFVIRTAGNVVGDGERGSLEYAAHHLGVKLVVVLGHTRCGAVNAAIGKETHGFVGAITRDISEAIGCCTDEEKACRLNVRRQTEKIEKDFPFLSVVGAVYDVSDGRVLWSDEA